MLYFSVNLCQNVQFHHSDFAQQTECLEETPFTFFALKKCCLVVMNSSK